MPVDDLYEVAFIGKCDQADYSCVTHIRVIQDDSDLAFPEQTIADLLESENNLIDRWQNITTNDCSLEAFRIYRIHPTRGFPILFPTGPHVGIGTGFVLPANTGCRHTWYTNSNTKDGRGRHNWPGVPKDETHSGRITDAHYDLQFLFANSFEASFGTTPPNFAFEFGVVSMATGTPVFRTLLQAKVQANLRKQRTRTPAI